MSAFGYLAGRTARNWARLQLRRLRRVRYVLALLAGAFYIWLIFLRHLGGGPASVSPLDSPEALVLASVGALLPITFWWVAKPDLRALSFTDAERHILFTAPLSRRALILYKLGRGQLPVLLNVVIFSLLLSRDGLTLTGLQRAFGFWLIFTTFSLHRVGAALTRLSGRTRAGVALRRGAPVLVAALVLLAIALSIRAAAPRYAAAGDPTGWMDVTVEALRGGPAGTVLAPLRLLLAPVFTPEPGAWLGAVAIGILIVVAHLAWVLRADVAFEDAAATARAQEVARSSALAEGRPVRRSRLALPRLPLAPRGPPETAIIWKNTVPALDALNPILLAVLGLMVGVIAYMIGSELPGAITPGLVVAIGAIIALAAAVALGPFALRIDLRSELPRLDLLRSYPLTGEQVVRAHVLAVAVPLALGELALLAIALVASLGQGGLPMPVGERLAFALAAAFLLPAVGLVAAWVQNAAALLFPDWIRIGPSAGGGLEASGQQMLLFGGTWVVTLVLLVPTLLVVGVVALLSRGLGAWSMVPSALAAAIVLVLEVHLLVRWLGGVFERTDAVEAGIDR